MAIAVAVAMQAIGGTRVAATTAARIIAATSTDAGRTVAARTAAVVVAAAVAAIAITQGTGTVEAPADATTTAVAGVHGRGYHTARTGIHLTQRNRNRAGRRVRRLGE